MLGDGRRFLDDDFGSRGFLRGMDVSIYLLVGTSSTEMLKFKIHFFLQKVMSMLNHLQLLEGETPAPVVKRRQNIFIIRTFFSRNAQKLFSSVINK